MGTGLSITVLPGDGIGVEVTREAVRVLRAIADAPNAAAGPSR